MAIDALGRHIALAPGAVAELADQPDQGRAPTTVGENGVALSTAGRSGTCVVTIEGALSVGDTVALDGALTVGMNLTVSVDLYVHGALSKPAVTISIDDPGYFTPSNLAGVGAWIVDTTGFTALYKNNEDPGGIIYCYWFVVGMA